MLFAFFIKISLVCMNNCQTFMREIMGGAVVVGVVVFYYYLSISHSLSLALCVCVAVGRVIFSKSILAQCASACVCICDMVSLIPLDWHKIAIKLFLRHPFQSFPSPNIALISTELLDGQSDADNFFTLKQASIEHTLTRSLHAEQSTHSLHRKQLFL